MTTLVVGGTGKTGRRVAQRLRTHGVEVRAASRSGETAFDWDDRTTWAPALEGTDSAYVTFSPDLAVPGTAEVIEAFARQALASGNRRLVLLSGRGEDEAQRAERKLAESGAQWTVLRCSWFMQNFSEGYFLEPLLEGELALPAGDLVEAFVDADDIADVAVAALTENSHAGQVYELTGPRLLSVAEAVEEIGRASGRGLRYVPISMDDYAAGASASGAPDEVVDLLRFLFTEVFGTEAHLADGVQRALGREPRDFVDYARDAAAGGVWGRSARSASI